MKVTNTILVKLHKCSIVDEISLYTVCFQLQNSADELAGFEQSWSGNARRQMQLPSRSGSFGSKQSYYTVKFSCCTFLCEQR